MLTENEIAFISGQNFATMLQRKVLWLAYMVSFQDSGSCVDAVHCWQHRGLLELADEILQRGAGGRREREGGGGEVNVYMCVRVCDPVMLLGPYKKNTPLPATYLSNSNITTHTLYFGYSIILCVAMNRLHVMNQCLWEASCSLTITWNCFLKPAESSLYNLLRTMRRLPTATSVSPQVIHSFSASWMNTYWDCMCAYECVCVCVCINIQTTMNKI